MESEDEVGMFSTVENLRGHQISELFNRAGYASQLRRPALYETTLLRGKFACIDYPEGLSVHFSDCTELANTTSSAQISPRLSFIVLLKGTLNFALDEREFSLASHGLEVLSSALILRSSKTLYRKLQADNCVKKVHVSIPYSWLETHCPDMLNKVQALSVEQAPTLPVWKASLAAIAAAKAILAPSNKPPFLQKMAIEVAALNIVNESLGVLASLADGEKAQPRRAQQMAALISYLQDHLAEPVCMQALGRRFGMSVSTLQRYFRKETEMTVGEYVRVERLNLARERLREGRVTLSEAAHQANYNHTNNFITAYKRQFGCCPGSDVGR